MRLEGLLEMAYIMTEKDKPKVSKDFKDAFDEIKALNDAAMGH